MEHSRAIQDRQQQRMARIASNHSANAMAKRVAERARSDMRQSEVTQEMMSGDIARLSASVDRVAHNYNLVSQDPSTAGEEHVPRWVYLLPTFGGSLMIAFSIWNVLEAVLHRNWSGAIANGIGNAVWVVVVIALFTLVGRGLERRLPRHITKRDRAIAAYATAAGLVALSTFLPAIGLIALLIAPIAFWFYPRQDLISPSQVLSAPIPPWEAPLPPPPPIDHQ